jgi:protein TonB
MFTAHERALRQGGAAAGAVMASLALHAGIAAAFLALRPAPTPAPPPFYRVTLVAAPAAAPAAGAVNPPDTKAPPPSTKAPPRPKVDEVAPVPVRSTKVADRRATPNVSDTRVKRGAPAPSAGGGDQGATGADVGNIRTEGIDFPYPGYLENIVRQIRLRFSPPRGAATLKAEVMFLIRRDGSVTGFRFVQRSGSFTFDLEAQGAVENAARAFGPLPAGFREDVLPVMFSFDPLLIR